MTLNRFLSFFLNTLTEVKKGHAVFLSSCGCVSGSVSLQREELRLISIVTKTRPTCDG